MFRRPRLLALFLCTVAASMIAKPHAARYADGYQVVHTYPHDARAFTQGLICVDGHLYESTGLSGRSSMRQWICPQGRFCRNMTCPRSILAKGSLIGAAP